jgi:ribosomal protein S18 acetylase RimI-like enzyme
MTLFIIRRATVDDADAIANVHVTSWRETYRGLMPDDFLNNLSVERRVTYWRESLANPYDEYEAVVLAELDGEVVGFASFGRQSETDLPYEGELLAIYVLKSAHGKGIGRGLVTAVARDLLERGISSMLVWVLKDNPARGFYERLGGAYLRQKSIKIGEAHLLEVSYGWKDLRSLAPDSGE